MLRKLSHLFLGLVTAGAFLAAGSTAASAATADTASAQHRAAVAELRSLPEGQSRTVGVVDGHTVSVSKTDGRIGVDVSTQAAAGQNCVNAISIALIGLGVAAVGALLIASPASVFFIGGFEVGRGLLMTFVAAGGLTTAVLGVINAICSSFSGTSATPQHA